MSEALEWRIDTYRDVPYVRAETERLAEQLAALSIDPLCPAQRQEK